MPRLLVVTKDWSSVYTSSLVITNSLLVKNHEYGGNIMVPLSLTAEAKYALKNSDFSKLVVASKFPHLTVQGRSWRLKLSNY